MKIDEVFNVGNPSKENIEYAFKNLLFCVNSSICLEAYSAQKKSFEEVYTKIINVLSIYVNENNLLLVDEDILQDIKFDLIDLDVETKTLKSYYAEWSLMWIEALISLRVSLKNGGVNNGR